MDYYTGNSSLGHYTEPSRDSVVSQSSGAPSFTSASPSLNQRPRMAPDITSSNSRPHVRGDSSPSYPVYSQAGVNASSGELLPPTRPFGAGGGGSNRSSLMSASSSSLKADKDGSGSGGVGQSLSVNYLPSKFSRPHSPGMHPRRISSNAKLRQSTFIRGGGNAAFKAGEGRIASTNDEDYDGVTGGRWGLGKGSRLRWTRFKWIIFFMNLIFTIYSVVALVFTLLTWLNVWDHAEVILTANRTELILSTVAASLGVLTSLLGWAGILLNNRAFLAVYTVLLWVCFGLLVSPGYVTYKTYAFRLDLKLNSKWSRALGQEGRLKIQNKLECCGYFSPFVEATASQTCYARSLLPGCKGEFLRFERTVLKRWYTVAFSLVPLQLAAIFAGLMCSNHVTYRFGKGMMPKAYRLNMEAMSVIMDNYAQQLAEQYGEDVASDVLSKTRSTGGGGGSTRGLSAAPGSPLTQSFSSSNAYSSPAASLGSATTAVASRQDPTYRSNTPPSGARQADRRNSGYATYATSEYPMNSVGGGARPSEDGRRI